MSVLWHGIYDPLSLARSDHTTHKRVQELVGLYELQRSDDLAMGPIWLYQPNIFRYLVIISR